MKNLAWSIVLFVIPIIVIIGCIRMGFAGEYYNSFFPSGESIINDLSSFPDIQGEVSQILADFNKAASEVKDIVSFFVCVGNFFVMVFKILAIPFEIIGWLVSVLFGADMVPADMPTIEA